MLSKIFLRTGLNGVMKLINVLYLVHSCLNFSDQEYTKAGINKAYSNIHLLSNN